jgi:hypothetical protein
MESTYLNGTGVPLSVAVYLATSHYDHVPNAVSATSLMKPIRQQILAARLPAEQSQTEVLQVVKSRIGSAIHDGIEKAWTGGHYKAAMKNLGYPQKIIDRVVVNPEGTLPKGAIPVYMEQRMFREIDGRTISGKFDFIAEGRLEDFKSTGSWSWIAGGKEEDYQLQGSIYRWIDAAQPLRKITRDHMAIQFFFTDWMAAKAKADPAYPQRPVEQKLIPLLPLDDTEQYIRGKLRQFALHRNAPEPDLPHCTDKELWRKAPVFKYYRDPAKRTRSTKNFDTAAEAHQRLIKDGNVGVVVEVPGEVVACKYCPAFPVCGQKDKLIADGSLRLE